MRQQDLCGYEADGEIQRAAKQENELTKHAEVKPGLGCNQQIFVKL